MFDVVLPGEPFKCPNGPVTLFFRKLGKVAVFADIIINCGSMAFGIQLEREPEITLESKDIYKRGHENMPE